MESLEFADLEKKVHQTIGLVSRLRSENALLKEQLQQAKAGGGQKRTESKRRSSASQETKKLMAEVKRLEHERSLVRQKVRNVLRKLEAIKLEEQKNQQDLFD